MPPVFVLILWGIVGAVIASVGAVVLGGGAAFLTRRAGRKRWPVVIAASLLPFVCLVSAFVMLLFTGFINQAFLNRDLGFGDSWRTPLPNGYAISMIDVLDHGTVYNPKTQPYRDGISSQSDTIFNVKTMQVAGPYIIVAALKEGDGPDKKGTAADSFVIIDTRTGAQTSYADEQELGRAAKENGVTMDLRPIEEVYGQYRFTWFDKTAWSVFAIPPVILFVILVIWVRKLRRSSRFVRLAEA